MYPATLFLLFAPFVLLVQVQAAPTLSSILLRNNNLTAIIHQNGLDAQALNKNFATLNQSSSCNDSQNACVFGLNATCTNGNFVLTPCSNGNTCFAVPLLHKQGTKLVCDTRADALKRFSAAGVDGGLTGDDSSSSASATETLTVTVTVSSTDSNSASSSAFTQTQTLSAFTLTFTNIATSDTASASSTADLNIASTTDSTSASTSDALAAAATDSASTDSAPTFTLVGSTTDDAPTITLEGSTDAPAAPTITLQASTAADDAAATIDLNRRQYDFFSSSAASSTPTAVVVSPSASLPPVNIVPTTVSPSSAAATAVVTPAVFTTLGASTISTDVPTETIIPILSSSSQATVFVEPTVPNPIISFTTSSQAAFSTLPANAEAPPTTVTVTVATATVTVVAVSTTTVLVEPLTTSSAASSPSAIAAPSASDQVIDINGSPTQVLTIITLSSGTISPTDLVASTSPVAAVAATTPAVFFTPTPY